MSRNSDATQMDYRLCADLRLAVYAGHGYLYDAEAEAGVIAIPTQRVRPETFRTLSVLQDAGLRDYPQPIENIQAMLVTPGERGALKSLLSAGYVHRSDCGPGNCPEESSADFLSGLGYIRPLTFFNLPIEIDDEKVDVGLVGLPLATSRSAIGTRLGSQSLRLRSRSVGNWLDLYPDGVYSEIGIADRMPRLLCKNVVLKDYGDIDCDGLSVQACFNRVAAFVDALPHFPRFRSLFVGGDHAATIPLVHNLVEHTPRVGLLHLDAHDDLFYAPKGSFSHASVVRELLLHTGIEHVCSFGLRTRTRPVREHTRHLMESERLRRRWHPFSLEALCQLLYNSNELRGWLRSQEHRPWYLSIDLDILSGDAIENQLARPAGHGLAWHQLYALVDILFSELDIVAADVVELDPHHRISSARNSDSDLMALLLLLIHHMACNRDTAAVCGHRSRRGGRP